MSQSYETKMTSRGSGSSTHTLVSLKATRDNRNFSSNLQNSIATLIRMSRSDIYRDIQTEISAKDWVKSLDYSDDDINKLLDSLLEDFDLGVDANNRELVSNQINEMLKSYEKRYSLELSKETRKMLRNLIVRMSYDKLCVKNLI